MINPADVTDKENKVNLEELRARFQNQRTTLAMLQDKHKTKIEKLIEEISDKLKTEHQPLDKSPPSLRELWAIPEEGAQAAFYKAYNSISFEHFIGLMTAIKAEELERLDKINLDRIPKNQLEFEAEAQNKQHLINALGKVEIKSLKLLHAIINQQPDLVLELLEQGVDPNFSMFNIYVVYFLIDKIVMEPFSEIDSSKYLELLAAYENPDVLMNPENPKKNCALKILELLLCYSFQPGYLTYNAPGTHLILLHEPTNDKEDLIQEVLCRKSFLVNYLKGIDETHATKLIPSVLTGIYKKLFTYTSILVDFSGLLSQEREEIAELLEAEQQKIERSPIEAGLNKFMEVSEIVSVIPCRPVAALVFKYLADPNKNVFEAIQAERRYKYIFNGIIPVG